MLRQSGDGKLSLSIRRESSMQNSRQPVRYISDRHRVPCDIPDAVVPTRQVPPTPGEQSCILRAISLLGSAVLEGFALYGQSYYPCSLDRSEHYHAREEQPHRTARAPSPLKESPRLLPGGSSPEIDLYVWLASAPSHSPRSNLRWFRLATGWPRRRTVAAKRASLDSQDLLDDRLSRDGGTNSDDIGTFR
jgi:hypothetical protein